MVYLFLGNNATLKNNHISKIRNKFHTVPDAAHFDYQLLYADKLDKDTLKKALLELPAVAQKRIVVVKQIDKLKVDHKKILSAFFKESIDSTILILDSDKADIKNAFISECRRVGEVNVCDSGTTCNVWDMTNAMKRSQHVGALKTLNTLIDGGESPVKILGALVWFWGKMKDSLSRKKFQKGLMFLQETDLNIKRSRLNPTYALEKCVISLSALIA